MPKNTHKLKSKVWLYPGMAGWHFANIPDKESRDIKARFGPIARAKGGWGAIPVIATIGKTSWKTSIFPDKKSGVYLLPLKAEVRKKEEIFTDDMIVFSLEIRI